MHRIFILVENGESEPVVEGRYEFEVVPRVGECFTIGALGREAIFRVTHILHHVKDAGDRLQPLDWMEIKAEVAK